MERLKKFWNDIVGNEIDYSQFETRYFLTLSSAYSLACGISEKTKIRITEVSLVVILRLTFFL